MLPLNHKATTCKNILPELNLSANYVNVDYTDSDTVTKNANNNVTGWIGIVQKRFFL